MNLTESGYLKKGITAFPESIAVGGIAGIKYWASTNVLFNDLNDGVVSRQSVWLQEMKDLIVLPLDHLELTNSKILATALVYFNKHHRFPKGLYRANIMKLSEKFTCIFESYYLDKLFERLKTPNADIVTMGGNYFWINLTEIEGWKLQKNNLTGHIRVLNPSNIRKAWSSEAHFQQSMDIVMSQIAADKYDS